MHLDELESIKTEMKELEERLAVLRKEYREKKYANLKMAMEAKKEADKVLQEEWKALGYSSFPFNNNRDFFSLKW